MVGLAGKSVVCISTEFGCDELGGRKEFAECVCEAFFGWGVDGRAGGCG